MTEPFNPSKALPTMRHVVSEGIRVFASLPDPDARFRGIARNGLWSQSIREASESYGYQPTKVHPVRDGRAIQRADLVMGWLAALRQSTGDTAPVGRLIAIAFDTPMHVIAGREGVSEKTVRRRADESLCWIMGEFLAMPGDIPVADEADEGSPAYSRNFEPGDLNWESPNIEPGKVYIGGIGWFYRGRKWNDGQAKAGRMKEAV